MPAFQRAIRSLVEHAKEMVEFRHFGERRAGEVVQSVEKGSVDDHAGPQRAEICRRDGSAEPSRVAEGQGEKVHQDHADGRREEHHQLEKEDRLLVMFPADEVGQMGQDTAPGRHGGQDDGHAGETHDAFRCLCLCLCLHLCLVVERWVRKTRRESGHGGIKSCPGTDTDDWL